jgi:hypothetical protein
MNELQELMSECDYDNLQFLLAIENDPEAFQKWYNACSEDDLAYASELLEQASELVASEPSVVLH